MTSTLPGAGAGAGAGAGTEAGAGAEALSARARNLHRLLKPRHIAVFGGRRAAEVVRQCRRIGFDGEIWPVHPTRRTVEGLPCYPEADALPEPPDASFVAVSREPTIEIVSALARRGAGGVVCYASGFAEAGGSGIELQHRLVEAAGDLAVIGPNCYGVLNYLDGAALWPDEHGGVRTGRGAAIITQSGNIGLNLTMQRRSLPLAYLITMGNGAGLRLHEVVDGLLDDPRVSAIGLHIEGLEDVVGFSRVALKALERRIPLVALKAGSSELGARTALSHTSSLAGSDALYETLFRRMGVARVRDLPGLLETLKFFAVHGALPGARIASASCSGGEASLVADLAQPRGVELPRFPARVTDRLGAVLGDRVALANPLDYHTYIWGERAALTECFDAVLGAGFDAYLLVLDLPRAAPARPRADPADRVDPLPDRADPSPGQSPTPWETAVEALVSAHRRTPATACLVGTLPEGLPEEAGARLLAEGIAPMQGLTECLDAVAAAAAIGAAQAGVHAIRPLTAPPVLTLGDGGGARMLDEWEGKRALAARGVRVPEGGAVTGTDEAVRRARELGFPVVLKAVSASLAHKTEAGAVRLDLTSPDEVRLAATEMRRRGLPDRLLVERMLRDPVAELIVGVHRDPQFGQALTLGAGGTAVELLRDTAILLLPASRQEIRTALGSLRTWPLLDGYRGRPKGDIEAVLDAVTGIAEYARDHAAELTELEVNPLLVMPEGSGAYAVDVLVRLTDSEPTADEPEHTSDEPEKDHTHG
ncbi:acetate--CoA ligase family protein [Streptomyces sp. HC44]|uniref:Acetate--CoA ligase family protein n=1 Tax=Streptomyces scabichelini TaxID=2711217 RepID=A0A6G4V6I6_9ACTN|nr:acetate--CoA ligase family protein [Streptomyces scabichelini]NGO09591.1 acetate--CoA ligase family protein [Streptomyces scabichelini]